MLLKYDKQKNILTASRSKHDACDLSDVSQIAMFLDQNHISNIVLVFDFEAAYSYITYYVTLLRTKLLAIGSKCNGKLVCHWIRENLTDQTHDRVIESFKRLNL